MKKHFLLAKCPSTRTGTSDNIQSSVFAHLPPLATLKALFSLTSVPDFWQLNIYVEASFDDARLPQ